MKIKTFLTFLLAMAFAFSLSACNGDDEVSSSLSSSVNSETASESESESESSSSSDEEYVYAPAGTLDDPFWIAEDVTEVKLDAGQEIYFASRGSESLTFEIANENVSVLYKGTTYTAENGVVSFAIIPEIGSITIFSVKNNVTEAIETTLTAVYPLGSRLNPFELTGDSGEQIVELPQNNAVYYKWVATQDGEFTISCEYPQNNISMQNGYVASDATLGGTTTSIACKTGDEILIAVGALDNGEHFFSFTYSI